MMSSKRTKEDAAQQTSSGPAGKRVHLSVDALKEYDRCMGHSSDSGTNKSVASMKTNTTPPSSLSSLYGITLSLRAWQITKKLSRSVYLQKAQERDAKTPSDKSEKCEYENTYKTEPDAESRFPREKIQEFIEETLQQHLTNKRYKAIDGSRMSVTIANVIKDRVKTLNVPRYKIVAHVLIGEKSKNGVLMSSRCLWDCKDDSYATANFENSTLYAIGTVYGVYYE